MIKYAEGRAADWADAREEAGGVHFKRVAAGQKRHEADIKLS